MIISDSAPKVNHFSDAATFEDLHAELNRGGKNNFVWTPNTNEFYTDKKTGELREAKRTQWFSVDRGLYVPAGWWKDRNIYFGVNPTDAPGKAWQRSTNKTVSAVNCFFAEYDGKDHVTEAEWLPHYTAPDLDGLTDAKARGALVRAQTAAIDAAYKVDPEEYRRRALAHLRSVEPKPTAAWDSGGGYQAVWLFTETQRLDTDERRQLVAHYQKEWVYRVGGDPGVNDLCRVLRVVGSVNYKPKYAPDYPLVSFLWCDLSIRYTFDELSALLPPPTQKTKPTKKTVHVPSGAPVDLASFGDVPDLPRHGAIDAYNQRTNMREALLAIGYTDAPGERMNRPGGDTAGVQLHNDNSASIYSANDPLYCGHRVRPAHVLCVYEYAGDVAAMLAVLSRGLTETLEACRQFVRRADFAQHVPIDLQAVDSYRTGDTDKAMALGVLSLFAQYGRLEGPISLLQLSEATGRSVQTCANSLRRLTGWFVECMNEDTRTPDQARVYRLCDWLRRLETSHVVTDNSEPFPIYATLPMDTHRAHDAFVRSMKPLTPEELAARIEARRADGKEAKATGDERRRVAALLPSAGPAALVVVDALTEFGPLRGVELCELTCKKKWTISRSVQRLKELSLVEIDADGAVALVPGWKDHLNEITPEMPTYGTGRRRTIARCDAIIKQCEEITEKVADPPKWVHRRLERAITKKSFIAGAEGFDGKATRRALATGNHSLTWWQMKQSEWAQEVESVREQFELKMLRDDGMGKRDAVHKLILAGYDKNDVWRAAHRVFPAYDDPSGATKLAEEQARSTPTQPRNFADLKQFEAAAQYRQRFGVDMPAGVAA